MGRAGAALLVASTVALLGAVAWGVASGGSPWLALLAVPLAANVALAVVLGRAGQRVRSLERERLRLAGLDPVTQVASRATFEFALEDALAGIGNPMRGRRTGDATGDLAVIVLAVEPGPDATLRTVAARLRDAVRPVDVLARTGAAAFGVIAPGAGSAGARRLAEALRIACAGVDGADGQPLQASVAWALHPSDGTTAAALLEVAEDRRLAAERGAGRRAAPARSLVPRPRSA